MNLSKLFEMQRQLDAHIEKEHPRQEGEDRLAKKILSLQVELGELANEWRGFKFWSKDQEPRTLVEYDVCKYCNGLGFIEGEILLLVLFPIVLMENSLKTHSLKNTWTACISFCRLDWN